MSNKYLTGCNWQVPVIVSKINQINIIRLPMLNDTCNVLMDTYNMSIDTLEIVMPVTS